MKNLIIAAVLLMTSCSNQTNPSQTLQCQFVAFSWVVLIFAICIVLGKIMKKKQPKDKGYNPPYPPNDGRHVERLHGSSKKK